ncbi:MAG: serine/threonine protein kinase, partial [Flavobacteriia bacterium]
MIGKQIQNYTIIKLIGEGGMGDVYLAEHNTIKRKVAIKVLKAELVKNEEIKKRFKNEASVMAQLQQVNIVGLLDYVEQEDGLYLIMEFVEGKTLDIFLAELNEPLNIERSKKIMLQILNAFSYAHQNGIVHRDVKPSNIIINSNDEIKVLDFGIAKIIGGSQHNLTKTGVHIGTVYYMSPEQVKAVEVDARSDIYSLGITFYELLAGFCPYKNAQSEYEIYNKIVNDPLISLEESLGNQYHEVWKVIKKATQKKPEDRFSSCEEFALALTNEIKIQEQKKTVVSKPEQQHKAARTEYFEEEKKSYKGLIVFLILAALISFG